MNLEIINATMAYSPLMDRMLTDKYYTQAYAYTQSKNNTKWNNLSKTVKNMTSKLKNIRERRNSHDGLSHIQICE